MRYYLSQMMLFLRNAWPVWLLLVMVLVIGWLVGPMEALQK